MLANTESRGTGVDFMQPVTVLRQLFIVVSTRFAWELWPHTGQQYAVVEYNTWEPMLTFSTFLLLRPMMYTSRFLNDVASRSKLSTEYRHVLVIGQRPINWNPEIFLGPNCIWLLISEKWTVDAIQKYCHNRRSALKNFSSSKAKAYRIFNWRVRFCCRNFYSCFVTDNCPFKKSNKHSRPLITFLSIGDKKGTSNCRV